MTMQACTLKTEWQHDPLAVEPGAPRLSWVLEATPGERGKQQSAYQVVVSSSPEPAEPGKADAWDTGKVMSGEQLVEYGGASLRSRMVYRWQVRVWDEAGVASPWSEVASFRCGLRPDDWSGKWIGATASVPFEERFPVSTELADCPDWIKAAARREHPAGSGPENPHATGVHLRREFEIATPVERAVLRIAGLGYHEVSLNGRRVGDQVLDPAATDYTKTVYYVTHDVTGQVHEGGNCIGVLLGNGWFWVGTPDLFGFERARWAAPPRCLLELEIVHPGGGRTVLVSDGSWWCTTGGPVRFNCIRGGEVFDATVDLGPWNVPGGVPPGDPRWQPVVIVDAPGGVLRPQAIPPMRVMDTFAPCKRVVHGDGKIVYWFPRNNAGWVEITIEAARDQRVLIELNEKLHPDGTVDMLVHSGHTYGRYQTLEYTCRGGGVESWEPRFCYAGFQYAQVTGVSPDQVIGVLAKQVCTSLPPSSTFQCSSVLVNAIHEASRLTFLNGFHSYPEDCPQREKAGWTEDGQLAAKGSVYAFDTLLAYEKWIRDLIDAQHDPTGQVPDIVPTPGWGKPDVVKDPADYTMFTPAELGNMADPWWGGSIAMLPWTVYQHHGDPRVLAMTYTAMKRYVDFLTRTTRFGPGEGDHDNLINWATMLGEWLEVGSFGSANRTPRVLTSTQAYFHCASIVSDVAALLGHHDDAARYRRLAGMVKDAFNEEFLDEGTGLYWQDSQSAQAMSLLLGLVPPGVEGKVLDRLVENVHERGGHLSTGIVGTYYLYHALARHGRPDLALDVITASGEPGFEHVLTRVDAANPIPAGTIWEDWGGRSSLAHPVQACVISWLYEGLAGVRPLAPGFRRFRVDPFTGGRVQWVKASIGTTRGTIRVDWRMDADRFTLDVEVPPNATAEICLPAASIADITEGGKPVHERAGITVEMHPASGNVMLVAGSGIYQLVTARVPEED